MYVVRTVLSDGQAGTLITKFESWMQSGSALEAQCRHDMLTLSASLAVCGGNPPTTFFYWHDKIILTSYFTNTYFFKQRNWNYISRQEFNYFKWLNTMFPILFIFVAKSIYPINYQGLENGFYFADDICILWNRRQAITLCNVHPDFSCGITGLRWVTVSLICVLRHSGYRKYSRHGWHTGNETGT